MGDEMNVSLSSQAQVVVILLFGGKYFTMEWYYLSGCSGILRPAIQLMNFHIKEHILSLELLPLFLAGPQSQTCKKYTLLVQFLKYSLFNIRNSNNKWYITNYFCSAKKTLLQNKI
jgi:hypothetical protein